MVHKRPLFLGVLLSLVAAVSGCSIAPTALSEPELTEVSAINADRAVAAQEPLYGAIGLHEAIARALKFNLDHRLEMMQQALREAEGVYANFGLLPKVVAQAGYSKRNNELIVSSLDIESGESFEPNTISQDREYSNGDVTFSWDILDFALSYVRARQASDKYLIQQETRRRVVQRIIEDTRTAYWRAVTADRMSRKLAALQARVQSALAGTRQMQSDGSQSPLTALTSERELIEIKRTAESLQHELNMAKSQLASLMNIAPGTNFKLADETPGANPGVVGMDVREMVAEAIFNRPEIREVAYEKRIQEDEAIAAILELLPNVKEYGMEAFNDNSFLLHNDWLAWGTTIAGNLMKVVRLPETRAWIEAEGDVIQTRALATTMVVMTQVYVSRTRYAHFQHELETAAQYVEVQTALVDQLRAERAAEAIGDQTLIREEMNLLIAEVERDVAIADLESAAANLMVSMGLDLQPPDVDLNLGARDLAGVLRARWSDYAAISDRGRYFVELEQARLEALRKKEAEEKRIRDEQRRIAEEAQRVKDEEIRIAKEEAKRAADEAKQAKAEADRIAKEEAKQRKLEAAEAKRLADAEKAEQKRVAESERRQRDAEKRQAELEAKRANDEARLAAKAEARRLKEEAQMARAEARRARKEAVAASKSAKASGGEWKWVWPWEESRPRKHGAAGKSAAKKVSTSQ